MSEGDSHRRRTATPRRAPDRADRRAKRSALDLSLRPRSLARVRRPGADQANSRDVDRSGTPARRSRSITCCSPGRRGSARLRSRILSRASWASTALHFGTGDRARGRSGGDRRGPRNAATCFSSTRSIASPVRSRRSSIPRWRTTSSISWSGKGAGARSMKLAVKPFTLVGATTRSGLLSSPLRDRFGQHFHLDFYDQAGADRDRAPLGAAARSKNRRRRRGRDRLALARHAASRQPYPAPGARLRAGQRGAIVTQQVALGALELLDIDTMRIRQDGSRHPDRDHRQVRRRPGRRREPRRWR